MAWAVPPHAQAIQGTGTGRQNYCPSNHAVSAIDQKKQNESNLTIA